MNKEEAAKLRQLIQAALVARSAHQLAIERHGEADAHSAAAGFEASDAEARLDLFIDVLTR